MKLVLYIILLGLISGLAGSCKTCECPAYSRGDENTKNPFCQAFGGELAENRLSGDECLITSLFSNQQNLTQPGKQTGKTVFYHF